MPEYTYDIPQVQSQVTAVLDQCESVANLYTNQIRQLVDGCLATCGGTWANCESCIEGAVADKLVRSGTVAAKCVGKLIDRAQMMFNRAQILAQPVINQLPELRDIVAAEMVGAQPAEVAPVDKRVCLGANNQPISCDQPQPPATGGFGGPTTIQPRPPGAPCSDQPPGVTWMGCGGGGVDTGPPLPPAGGEPPIPPAPGPGTQPTCPVVKPDCPPGFTLTLDAEANQFVCKPNLPNCPPPSTGCPTGQEWQWDAAAGVYRCVDKPKPPKPPEPPAPSPTDDLLGIVGFPNWNQLTCPDLSLSSAGDAQTLVNLWDNTIQTGINRLELATHVPGSGFAVDLVNLIDDAVIGGIGGLVKSIGDRAIKYLFRRRDCDYLQMIPPMALRAVLSLVEHWLDIGLDETITTLSYTIDRACPTLLPGGPGIDTAYLGNKITFDTWKCWQRAINNLDVPAQAVMEANRNQPNTEQWIVAWMRGLLPNEQVLNDKLRGVGVIDQKEADVFKKLLEQFPGPGDIVRFMLRDVADDIGPNAVVNKFSLDQEFGDKFKGLLSDYAKGQGLSVDLMKYYWRAHWDWPSPSQLYEMLHRLRPDNSPPNLQVTLPDVVNVLGINDVIPYFRDRLAAISYRLPRLRDAFGLFDAELWKEPQLLDYYQSYGYPKDIAEKKVQLDARKKGEAKYKLGALLTKTNVTNAFIAGAIGESEARLMLSKTLLGQDEINRAIDHAKDLRLIALRKKIAKSIKCRFVMCEFGQAGAVAALTDAGWDATDAVAEVTCWKQQCEAKPKEATTAQLCKWFGLNLLSLTEYRSRLYRLGWSRNDVERIIGECVADLQKKASKNGTK